jgi:hypothetical protein
MPKRETNFPSSIKQKPSLARVVRFVVDNSTNGPTYTITRGDLLRIFGFYLEQSSSTYGVFLFNAVKLERVCMWASNDTTAFSSLSLEWLNPAGPQNLQTDTGTLTKPAHVSSSPPRNSPLGFWSTTNNSSESLFRITVPLGAIIDVHLTFVMEDGTGLSIFSGPTSISPGLYANALDNSNANPDLLPVDLEYVGRLF